MDWSKKEMEFLTRAADVFDLPADIIGNLPHLELIGDCQLLLSNHQGILSYSTETIDINGGKLILRVQGEGMELMAMNGSELRIKGKIAKVELM